MPMVVVPMAVSMVAVPVDRDRLRLHFDQLPAVVHQQLLGLALGVPGLGEHLLHRLVLVLLLAADDPAGQGHHHVVAVVPVGRKPVLRQLPLDGQGALHLLRHQLQRVGL